MDICEIEYKDTNDLNRHPWELARKKFILFLIQKYRKKLNPSDEFIDIGCGDCFLINYLAQNIPEHQFSGIDTALSDTMNDIVLNNITSDNVQTYNNLDKLPNNSFQKHFMLFDVIEHIEDDKEFLSSLQQNGLVSPNSLMFITVPAFNCLYNNHDKKLKHFRRYTTGNLKKLVKDSGFIPLEYSYFFFSLIIIRALHKCKLLPNKIPSLDWKYSENSLITRLIRFTLYADAKICRFFSTKLKIQIPGLSCYIICQKQ